jgi:hypothetical protein
MRLRRPDFETIDTRRWQGCQPCALATFALQKIFLIHISLKGLSQPQGHSAATSIMSMKNANDINRNQTYNLPACSAVPQPTAPFTFMGRQN